MISKDNFIQTMCALETLNNKMDNVDAALQKLCPDFGGFYIPDIFDIVMKIFAEMFDDEGDWLGYFVYEKDFLNKLEAGDVLDADDNPIDIKNWGDVYNFLLENMEE